MLKSKVFFLLSATALAATLPTVGCGGSDDETTTPGATAGAGGGKAGSSGKAGTGGTTGGTGGTAGKAGAGGTTGGTGGTAGKAGAGGAGAGGTAGKAGASGAGAGGTAGKAGASGAGAGGTAGTGGTAGKAGASGAGAGGTAGTAGTGGTAGKAGASGAGAGGTAGTAGTAGTGGGGTSGGKAAATVSTAAADFGLVDCGGTAPANQTVTIQNTGTAPLTVAASVSGSNAFSIVGSSSLTIAAGASDTITVAAAAVPSSATAGAALSGTLTLATNDPTKASITVALTETPQGATLSWVTPASGAYDFGQVSTGSTGKSGALDLKNTGNAPVDVTWGAASDAAFSVLPATGTLAAGASLAGLEASYAPTADGAASGSIPFTTTGVLCGTNASKLDVSGSGVSGAITVSGDLNFGSNPCGGTAAAPQTITLTNSGAGAYTFTATNGNTNAYTVSPASGTVAAGGTFDITVTPAAIPFPSPVPGSYADAVTIKTSIPGDPDHLVQLTQSAKGAVLSFSQSAVNFVGVPVNGTTSTGFDIQNTGNDGATVTLQVTNTPVFGATPGGQIAVVAGTPSPATVTFSPLDNVGQIGEVSLLVDAATVLCEPAPAAMALAGTGLNGGVLLDKQSVDFGQVNCGTTAGAQTVKLTNNGNAPFDWTGTVGGADSGKFTVAPLSGTALAPGASVDITVTPAQVAQFGGIAQLTANLQITTTVINDAPHNIAITETPRGAVFAWGPTVDFNEVPITKTASQNAILTNNGNAPATVNYAIAAGKGTAAGEFTLAAATGTAAVGDTTVGTSFNPVAPPGTKTATLNLSTSDVLCAPVPAGGVQLTGKATIGSYVQSGNYAFGAVNCGATAAPKSITITNSGSTAFTLTSIALTNNQWYTVSNSGTTVNPGGPGVTVTLTPKQIPFPSIPGSYNDSLTITTDIPGDVPHITAVTESSQGAILSMTPVALTFPNTQVNTQENVQFLLKNTGNLPANVSYSITSGGPWFSIDPKTVAGGAQIVGDARFVPSNNQAYADTATMNVSNTVLCQPLPANTQAGGITLAGTGVPAGAGVFGLSPTSAIYGGTAIDDPSVSVGLYCGSGAGADAKTFQIQNSTVSAANFTATLTSGAGFYTLSAASGTVGANTQFPLTVSSKAIAIDAQPGAHRDGVLQVVIGGNTYTANLTTVVAGTNLKFLNDSGSPIIALNLTGTGVGTIQTFTILNDGNSQFNFFLRNQQSNGPLTWWFYPWAPNGFANYAQINLGAQASVQDGVYWTGPAGSTGNYIVVDPSPITTGVHCTANYTGFLVTH